MAFRWKILKNPKVRGGNIINIKGNSYMVCQVGPDKWACCSTNNGNRWREPITKRPPVKLYDLVDECYNPKLERTND